MMRTSRDEIGSGRLVRTLPGQWSAFARIGWAGAVGLVWLGACSQSDGCSKDTDCKGERICSSSGQCVMPGADDGNLASSAGGDEQPTGSSSSADSTAANSTAGNTGSASSADASVTTESDTLFGDAPTVDVALDEVAEIDRPVPRMVLATDGVATGDTPIIDDFEDAENGLNDAEGRRGGWFLYNDGTDGLQTPQDAPPEPIPGGREDSEYAFRTTSSEFSDWGSGVGFTLVYPDDSTSYFYDASAYDGITFWIRGSMQSAPATDTCEVDSCTLRFGLQTPAVIPLESQGDCDETLGSCYDVFGAHLTLTDDWKRLSFRWQDLSQAGWGLPAVFNPEEVYAFIFEGRADSTYEVWIDDIAFFSGDPPGPESIPASTEEPADAGL